MYKRFAAGLTAVLMLASSAGLTVFADDLNQDYSMTDEIGYDVLSDDEDDFSSSPNLMVQELLDEVETLEEGGISPQWAGGNENSTHGIIASACMSEFGSNYTQAQLDLIEECMVYGAYKADTKDLHHRAGDKVPNKSFYPKNKLTLNSEGVYCYRDEVVSYHAVPMQKDGEPYSHYGNYLKYLRCIWEYAKRVSEVKYSNGQYEDLNLRNSIFKQVNVLTGGIQKNETVEIQNLLYSIHFIFDHYADYKHLNRELTVREKKYLVVGLGLHLIGDIHAHRDCVPVSYATDPKFTAEFVDTGYILPSKLEQLRTRIATGNFYCTNFNSYVDENNMGEYKSPGTVFEDNPSFLYVRYYASLKASERFVSEFLKSGSTFSPEKIIVDNCAVLNILGQDNQDRLKLYNYSTYLNDM